MAIILGSFSYGVPDRGRCCPLQSNQTGRTHLIRDWRPNDRCIAKPYPARIDKHSEVTSRQNWPKGQFIDPLWAELDAEVVGNRSRRAALPGSVVHGGDLLIW